MSHFPNRQFRENDTEAAAWISSDYFESLLLLPEALVISKRHPLGWPNRHSKVASKVFVFRIKRSLGARVMLASYVDAGESVELTFLYCVELIGLDPWALDPGPRKKICYSGITFPRKNLPLSRHLLKFVEKEKKLIMILCSKTHQGR